MKKTGLLLLIAIYLLGLVYLFMPHPHLPVVPGGALSDEPGDTWQNPQQKAYYTDLRRGDLMDELERQYSSNLGIFSFFSFRLNYPPEEAQILVRDQLKSYYLEEVVHPFRESLFINGWEPDKAPVLKTESDRLSNVMTFQGKNYLNKITLKPNQSSLKHRLIVWTLIFPLIFLVLKNFKHSLFDRT